MSAGRGTIYQTLYLNVQNGVIGILNYNNGSMPSSIEINNKELTFAVISKKGQIFNYSNSTRKYEVLHKVSTGNTSVQAVSFTTRGRELKKKTIKSFLLG